MVWYNKTQLSTECKHEFRVCTYWENNNISIFNELMGGWYTRGKQTDKVQMKIKLSKKKRHSRFHKPTTLGFIIIILAQKSKAPTQQPTQPTPQQHPPPRPRAYQQLQTWKKSRWTRLRRPIRKQCLSLRRRRRILGRGIMSRGV